ncbi:MAG: acetyl esterase/lipase [Cellvibrionaceae bacterium]|jgi:acetyl esterase/lipase
MCRLVKVKKIYLLLIPLILSGCKLDLLNLVTPRSGYSLEKNIEYGELDRQKLDIYRPTKVSDSPLTIVFFYGGAWQNGDKKQYRFVAQALADRGYQVIIPNYRVYPEVLFPGFMSDAAQALNWIIENINQPLVLMGHSAGAHIAALLALDETYLGDNRSQLKGFIGLSGAYDFLPLKSETLQTIFDAAENLDVTQPINFVSSESPPALLIHGLDDKRVLPKNSRHLEAALQEQAVEAELVLYPEAGHGITVGAIAKLLQNRLPVLEKISDFLNALKEKS